MGGELERSVKRYEERRKGIPAWAEYLRIPLPDGAELLPDLTIGGKTPKQLVELLDSTKGIHVGDFVSRSILRSKEFTTLSDPQTITPVKVTPLAMGFTSPPTIEEIFTRADEFDWDKLPAEAACYLAIVMKDESLKEPLIMGMKQMIDWTGFPSVLSLERRGNDLWLLDTWAGLDFKYSPRYEFVFSLRK